jgi:hypothetical protein
VNPEELEALLHELLSGIQRVIQSGEILSDEFQGMLAQTLESLLTEIDQLRSQNPVDGLPPPPAAPPEQPQLNAGMPSSNIHSFGYDDKTGRLLVKFQGDYPQENGPVYAYGGVPKVIFDLFQKGAVPARTDGRNKWGSWWRGKVPSLGASLFTLIKNGGYQYQRLT